MTVGFDILHSYIAIHCLGDRAHHLRQDQMAERVMVSRQAVSRCAGRMAAFNNDLVIRYLDRVVVKDESIFLPVLNFHQARKCFSPVSHSGKLLKHRSLFSSREQIQNLCIRFRRV